MCLCSSKMQITICKKHLKRILWHATRAEGSCKDQDGVSEQQERDMELARVGVFCGYDCSCAAVTRQLLLVHLNANEETTFLFNSKLSGK